MKNTLIILFLLHFLTGCSDQKFTHQETVTKYYNAFNSSDYNKIKILINDSITIIEGDYVMPFTHDSFYKHFKWDSIFKSSYEIVEIKEKNNHIIASVSQKCARNEFLKNNPLTCTYKISFNSGKISKIETFECIDADWNIWQRERDSLVSWINKNHPKLDGFIHDLTMNGAINYLKAIELYKNRKTTKIQTQMELMVLSNYGAEEKIISDSTSIDQIKKTMKNLNWNKFHQVVLSTDNNNWIEVGGSLNEDGLSSMYEENGNQFIINKPPSSIDHMIEILISYFNEDGKFKTENIYE